MPQCRLKNTWFNPLYFHLRKYVDDPNIRQILVYGGKSSAKTFSICQLLLILGYTRKVSSIGYRKEMTTIKTTLKESFKKAMTSIYFEGGYQEMDFKFKCVNNAETIMRGMDSDDKIKGIEGYQYLFFDELDHYLKSEWDQANLSLRGLSGQKLFGVWNPVDENIWIKEMIDSMSWTDLPKFIEGNPYSKLHDTSEIKLSDDGKTLLIKTTYLDNKWIVGGDGYGYRDENLCYYYEQLKNKDYSAYNVFVLGNWGVIRSGGEYFPGFKEETHTGNPVYNPSKTLHLIFDFNVVPYMSSLQIQLEQKEKIWWIYCIDETCTLPPDNRTRDCCRAIMRKYGPQGLNHRGGGFYYGDYLKKSRSTGLDKKYNHEYDIIEEELEPILSVNPDRTIPNMLIDTRRDFMHEILTEEFPIRLLINAAKCPNLMQDMLYLKQNRDGEKLKQEVKDEVTGEKYQKYGHLADCLEYFCTSAFEEFIK